TRSLAYSVKLPAGSRRYQKEVRPDVGTPQAPDAPGGVRRDHARASAAHLVHSPEAAMQSPQVLVGTFDQMVEELQRRREPCGFSYVAFALDAYLSMGPVVESLSGT
ncbi:MAG TPA: hypothetical protein VKI20_05530, partial [Acidimicrobiales bacterium]|nr:hypothetical protein [Acidimicrobiales bacterium]